MTHLMMQIRNIGRAITQAAIVTIFAIFMAFDASAACGNVQPGSVSNSDPTSGEGMFWGAIRHTDHMGDGAPVNTGDKGLAAAAVGLLVGATKKRMTGTAETTNQLTPEELETSDSIAADWTNILMPYLTDVAPDAAKDNAFEIVAVGMAERQRLEHDLETMKEDQLSKTYYE